jgi:hypothetical protein
MKKTGMTCAAILLFCLGAGWALAGDGQALVEKTCTKCHDLGRVSAAYGVKDEAAWLTTVTRMLAKNNAPAVTPEEHAVIVAWLAAQKQ